MLTIGAIVLGVDDTARAVSFWENALQYTPRVGQSSDDWTVLEPLHGSVGTALALDVSETPPQDRPRMHLDLFAADAADQQSEIERRLLIGAQRVDWDSYPEDADFVLLADTEGNRFCVVDASRS